MTSNLASDEIAEHAVSLRNEVCTHQASGDEDTAAAADNITISKKFKDTVVKPILKRHFKRDEFLGRINEFVYFLPFSRAELMMLITKELEFWSKKAKEKHDMTVEWDKKALDFLVNGYDISYGARSIKHEVERRVVNQIAVAHEFQLIEKGSHILITADLPPEQLEPFSVVKSHQQQVKEEGAYQAATSYDIRLKKELDNNRTQNINLKMNSLGKYYVPAESND